MHFPPIANCPGWIVDLANKRHTDRADGLPVVELDSAAAIARARRYLQNDAPDVSEGERNIGAYRISATLKDFGISEPENLSLMLELWNGEKCAPPLDYEEMQRTVESAYKTGFSAPGSASPEHDFGDVPTQAEPPKRGRLYFERPDQLTVPHESPYLIKGLIDQHAASVVYGDSNVGKSFVMLDIAFHVAAGRPWRDHRVNQHAVAYVAAEGGRTIRSRVLSLKKHYGLDTFPLALIPCSVDLGVRSADTRGLIDLVGEAAKDFGLPIGLIVVDTLSRALAGGNENSSEDMGALIKNMDRLREHTHAHVSFVHHSGKDRTLGARGWSGLRAAVDTEIEISPGEIRVTKQRDMEIAGTFGFALESVPLGVDTDGDPITSCVVLPTNLSAQKDFDTSKLTKAQSLAFSLACEITDKTRHGLTPFDPDPWIAMEDFKAICWGKLGSGQPEAERKAFRRIRDKLEDMRMIEIDEENLRVIR
jgi:hypothetical protein